MAKYTGGIHAAGGYYYNPRSWSVEVVPQEGARLPGDGATKYVKIPFPLLFVVVPLLGALFLVFLPFIGFALFGYAIVKRLAGGARKAGEELAATVTPGWRPGEAHFTGKPGEEKPADGEARPELSELEKEIAAKKGEKK
jgi:hypothetical protein